MAIHMTWALKSLCAAALNCQQREWYPERLMHSRKQCKYIYRQIHVHICTCTYNSVDEIPSVLKVAGKDSQII